MIGVPLFCPQPVYIDSLVDHRESEVTECNKNIIKQKN